MGLLPELDWKPTAASSLRHGAEVELVVVHRWGVRYVSEPEEASVYEGVIRFFSDPANRASAHIVFPGSAVPGHATQMVPWREMAWTEAAYNPVADDVESADACWLMDASNHLLDPKGLEALAVIVAARLYERSLPALWSTRRGFCRHADLGQAGGGHLECPTTNLNLWRYFVRLVQRASYEDAAAFWGRPRWGR